MRPGLVLLLVALTGCASQAPVAASPAASSAVPASTAQTSAAPTSASPAPTSAAPSRSSNSTWPTPGPSEEASPVVGTVGPVAWLPLPYHSPVDQDDPTEPVGRPPWCTAGDLVLAATTLDAGGGYFYFGYSLTARPGRRCSLQGYPRFKVSDRKATWNVTNRPPDLIPVQPGGVIDQDHPGSAEFRWAGGGVCITVDTSQLVVALDLPHQGGRLTVEQAPRAWGCAAQQKAKQPTNTGWIIVEPLIASPPTVYAATPPVLLSLPSHRRSVRAGSTLAYQVQLVGHGPLAASVGYRERLVEFDTGKAIASEAYCLNTSGLPPLTRLGTLFDMKIAVPRDVTPGTQLDVDWESDIAGAVLYGSSPGPFTVAAADS